MARNKKIKTLSVFGTRPEAIKFAPLIKLMGKDKSLISKVCVSGQHQEMLRQVLDLFDIAPDYDLRVMQSNQNPADVMSKILNALTPILSKENPGMVLVQGDTVTALAGALAGYYAHIPVGHIEAGLRTGDRYQPFPEEINRRLISHLASLHFAPTKLNYQNLLKENISAKDIIITGNTVIDALFLTVKKNARHPSGYWRRRLQSADEVVRSDKRFILVTAHRRENFGKGLEHITAAIKKIARSQPEVNIIYPVHLNPNVSRPVYQRLRGLPNVYLIRPLDYETFVYLLNHCHFILTDSGGEQEEAPSLGKPVLVMRNKTERPEAVKAGAVKLIGAEEKKIFNEVSRLLKDKKYYEKMAQAHNPYGDGKAAQNILRSIKNYYA